MKQHTTIADVAEAINGLCYMDLRSIGEALAGMCAPDNGVRELPKIGHDFADMLCDWADGVGS